MTKKEKELIKDIGNLQPKFYKLVQENGGHDSDLKDFIFHLHAMQRIVMIRDAIRNETKFFNAKIKP